MKINGNLLFNADGSGVIQNAFIEQFASNPSGVKGRIYYNTTDNHYYYYDGTTWQQLSAASSAVSSFQTSLSGLTPSTATTGAITLAGTLGATSGGTGQSSYTTGDILYASSSTVLSKLAASATAGQVLTSNGAGVAPSYQATGEPSLTATYVGYGSGSNLLTGSNDFTWTEGSKTLTFGDPAGASSVTLVGSNGNGSDNGTDLSVQGGQCQSAASGNAIRGGSVTIQGGIFFATTANNNSATGGGPVTVAGGDMNITTAQTASAAHGGDVTVRGGNVLSTNTQANISRAGNLVLAGGDNLNTTTGFNTGNVTVRAGDNTGTGTGATTGSATVRGGNSASNQSAGSATLQGGNNSAAGGAGSAVVAGGTGTGGNAGGVTLQTAASTRLTIDYLGVWNLAGSSPGTNGQVFTSSGSASAPTWTSVVNSAVAGTGISVSGATGAVTISNTGVTAIAGTANQITASASTGSVTLSIPATFIAPGSIKSTTTTEVGTTLTVDSNTASSFIYSDASKNVVTTAAPTNGQILIGSTGAIPVKATVTGTANQIDITNGAGSITLSLDSTLIAPGSLTITGFTYESAVGGITAHSGGGQASATLLTHSYNVVNTVAASGDSIKLPVSAPGLEITVVNLGSNALAVFPQSGDQIDGGAVDASVPIPVGGTATYQSVNAGNWYTIDPVVVTSGAGLSVTYSPGETVLSNTGVTSFQTSLSGLTPSSSTTGAITLAGTLGVASGGTGASTLTAHNVLIGEGTSTVAFAAPGTQFQVLQSNGAASDPSFSSINLASSAAVGSSVLALANGGTNANLTASAGALVYSTASAMAFNTPGTTGQAAISGGTGAPTWQNVSASLTTNQILEGDGSGKFTAVGGTFTGSGSTSGVTLNGTVTNATDATTKAYVDAIAAGMTWKQEVDALATSNTALSGGATLTIDGFALSNGDRVLLTAQTSAVNNGIYTVAGIGTAYTLTRSSDMNTGSNADNASMFIENGTLYANSAWVQSSQPAVVGTNSLTFVQFSGGSVYTFTSGVKLVGSTVSANTDNVTIAVNSNQLIVDSSATANQTLLSSGTTGTAASWGALPLNDNNAVTGTLSVSHGGTGATTFTAHGVLVGEGTSAVTATAVGATGTVLTGNTGADPTFVALNTLAVTSIAGTANQITASASVGSVTLSLPSTVILPGSLEVTTTTKFDGLTYESTAAVSGAGTTQGTATAITKEYNIVTATAGNTGVELPTPAFAGAEITIVNIGAVDAKVYPATGGTIDGAGTNNAITVPAGGTWTGQASSTTQWYSIDPVVVNGTGISVTYSNGQTSISNTGVLSFSAGSTGLTPSSGTAGNVTLAGTLNLASGGTNASLTAVAGGLVYSGASALAISAAGTAGQFVLSGGTSAPTYLTNSTPIDTDGAGSTTLVVGTTFNFFGTANEITTTASGSTVTFSVPSTFVAPGSVTATTTLTVSGNTANAFLYSGTGGLVSSTAAPTNGQLLIGSTGAAPVVAALTAGTGITITNGAGSITIAQTAGSNVTSFQTSLSGLTPSSATTGAVTLAGTLGSTSGGTGVNNSTGAVGTALVASSTGNFTATPIQFNYDSTLHGGAAEYFAVNHALGQKYVTVQVYTQDTQYAIVSAASGGPSFTIAGDHTTVFTAGTYFIVAGSSTSANNTFYTVVSSTFGGVNTVITVTGSVTTQGASGEVVVGPAQIIPQGVFLVDTNNVVVTLNATLNVFIVVHGVAGVALA